MDVKTKKKISETKRTKESSKLKTQAKDCNLKQAVTKFKVSGNRKTNHISFDEYKEFVSQGKTRQDMIKITSKHLVGFYNNLLKGKYNHITKEDFEELYHTGNKLDKIAKHFHVPREDLTFLREFLGIKRKGATFQKRLKNEILLTEDQKSVIIGSILGDGSVSQNGYFSEKHGLQQEEYLRWKAKMLSSIIKPSNITKDTIRDKKRDTTYNYIAIRSKVHTFLHEMRSLFYVDNVKVIPVNISELITPLAFTVWYLDDGCTDWGYRKGIRSSNKMTPTCKICTECFTEKDQDMLVKSLEQNLGIYAETCTSTYKNRTRIHLKGKTNVYNALKIINKRTPTEDMLYKSDSKIYENIKQYSTKTIHNEHITF